MQHVFVNELDNWMTLVENNVVVNSDKTYELTQQVLKLEDAVKTLTKKIDCAIESLDLLDSEIDHMKKTSNS